MAPVPHFGHGTIKWKNSALPIFQPALEGSSSSVVLRWIYAELTDVIPELQASLVGVLTLPLTAAEIVYHAPGTYDRSLYPGLPPELGQLQNLTRLLLDNNPWTGCLPVAWRDQGLRFSEPLPFCTD